MDFILYSTPTCPKCRVIEKKLEKKGYTVTRVEDEETLKEKKLKSVPWLDYKGVLMDFSAANEFINELPEVK